MTRYIERPKLVRAIQFTGGNAKEVFDFCKKRIKYWSTADFYFAGHARCEMKIEGMSRYKTRDVRGEWRINGEWFNPVIAKEPVELTLILTEGDFLVQPKKADPLVMTASEFHQRYIETA